MKNYGEYSDKYLKTLIPFFVISMMLHVVILGGSLAYAAITGDKDRLKITEFDPPTGSDPDKRRSGHPEQKEGEESTKRVKVYRVDYFSKLLLEKPIRESATSVVKPPVEKKPKVQKPTTKPAIKVIPVEPVPEKPEIQGKVFLQNELMKEGEYLYFPSYRFTLIPYNDRNWAYFSSDSCKGYIIVYFVVDITKKDGFEAYFEWAKFFDYLFSFPGAKNPPTPIGVAEIIEDPYVLTPDVWSDAIRRRIEKEEYSTPLYKMFNFIDVNGYITNGLEITELEKPQVYFVDEFGVVRMKLEGRIRDINLEQTQRTLSVIKDMWGMSDIEAGIAVGAILSYQQKLLRSSK